MTYKDRLSPWCVVRHLPQSPGQVIARFRRRNNAEDHLRAIEKIAPPAEYSIVFAPVINTAESEQPTG